MESADRNGALELFRHGPKLLLEALRSCPRWTWLFAPANGLSIHEIIIHLSYREAYNYVQCRNFIALPGSSVPMYNPFEHARLLGYWYQSAKDALGLIVRLRQTTFCLLEQAPNFVWAHTMRIPSGEVITLEAWLNCTAQYIPREIEEIRRIHAEGVTTTHHRRRSPRKRVPQTVAKS